MIGLNDPSRVYDKILVELGRHVRMGIMQFLDLGFKKVRKTGKKQKVISGKYAFLYGDWIFREVKLEKLNI